MNNNVLARPALQTRVAPSRHPSQCIGNPYSQDLRALVIFIRQQLDEDDPATGNLIGTLRQHQLYPHHDTLRRWEEDEQTLGHFRPCCRTGNKFGSRLVGQDLIMLALYRVAYPKAIAAEINSFLYRANIGNELFSFYSPSQISKAEECIGMSRKKGSTTAYQAHFPINLRKRWRYWNLPYPLGVADVHRSRIIDLDECGLFVQSSNRPHGKAYKGMRVRELGPYQKGEKWNVLLAVCGEDPQNGNAARRWMDVWLEGGTTVTRMLDFMAVVLQDIGHANDDQFYVFTMDNLNSHRNVAVVALIHLYGHGVIYRAPYWAVDGAIEYIFNTILNLMRGELYEIRNSNDLVATIYESVQSIDSFANYFTNVGFIP